MKKSTVLIALLLLACCSLQAKPLQTFNQADRVRTAVFSADGNYIASAGDSNGINLWSSWGKTNAAPIKHFSGHIGNINSLAFSPDGNYLISGGDDKMTYLWEVNGGNTMPAKTLIRLLRVSADKVRSVAFSSDGLRVYTAGDERNIYVWDLTSMSIIKTFSWADNSKPMALAISPDNAFTAVGLENGKVIIFPFNDKDQTRVFSEHKDKVSSLSWSHDGKYLASGSYDGTFIIRDLTKGKTVKMIPAHDTKVNSVCFSSDGKYLATSGSDKTAKVWKTDAQSMKPFKVFTGHDGAVNSAVFSHNGKYLVTASDDKTVKLWDVFAEDKVVSPSGNTPAAAAATKEIDESLMKKIYTMDMNKFTKADYLVIFLCLVIIILLIMLLTVPKQQIPNIIHPKLAEERDIYVKNRCLGLDIRGFTKADAETQKIWAKQLNATLDKVLKRFEGYLLILIGDGALVCFLGTLQKPDVHIDFGLQFLEETEKYGFKTKMAISEGDDLLKNVSIDGQKSVNIYGNAITRAARLLARGDAEKDEIIIDKIAYDLYFCNAGSYRDNIEKDAATNKAVVNEATRKHEEELELTYVKYKISKQA